MAEPREQLCVSDNDGTPLTALQACLRTSDILAYGGPFAGTSGRRYFLPKAPLRSGPRSQHPSGAVTPVLCPVDGGKVSGQASHHGRNGLWYQ